MITSYIYIYIHTHIDICKEYYFWTSLFSLISSCFSVFYCEKLPNIYPGTENTEIRAAVLGAVNLVTRVQLPSCLQLPTVIQYPIHKSHGNIITMEDFISANNVELLYEKEDPPTYLHYNGSTKKPDPTLASPDIAALALRNITDDPGCG
jgi:hypothetical protein